MSKTLNLVLKFDREVDTQDDVVRYIDFDFTRTKTNQKSTRS